MSQCVHLILALVLLLNTEKAAAYLDSGSASMFLQVLVSAFVGALIFIKLNWVKLRELTKKITRKK